MLKTANTALEKEAQDVVNTYLEDCGVEWLEDLARHGCQSGMVSGLIYYSDTCAFFNRHKTVISELLADLMNDCGSPSPADLFGDKWDSLDPLALEQENQNLLAWFAFEETANRLANENGIEL